MTDETPMKLVNGQLIPMTEADIAQRKADQEAWERDEPIRIRMAQPAADAALADADLMRLWGEIHALWDDIEQTLFMAFYALSDDDFGLSRTIFFSQKNHAPRRAMVLELARTRFWGNDAALAPFTKVLKRVAARADSRNNLFHGQWGWRNQGTLERTEVVRFVIEANMSPTPKLYGSTEMQAVRREMKSTLDELRAVIRPYVDAKMTYDTVNFFNRRRLW